MPQCEEEATIEDVCVKLKRIMCRYYVISFVFLLILTKRKEIS